MHKNLTVTSYAGQAALEQWATQMDDLNRASTRPNPYLSSDYLRCFSQHNEYGLKDDAIRLYTVREGEKLIGCLPLRQVQDRFGPLRSSRLCFLVPFDIEQPGMLCAPDDEQRVAQALVRHICDDKLRTAMFELIGQRPGSALYQAMHEAADTRFRVRDIPVEPFSEIPVQWPHLESYFRALSSSWRRNVARCGRLLFGAGTVEIVFAEGAQATSAWFDAYLDLESRSWKHGTSAAIARHPKRTELFRRMIAGQGGFIPSFIGVLLDGFLITGTLNGSNAEAPADKRGVWGFEMAYDDSYADLGPGILLDLLLVHTAIQREEKFVNLLNGFSEYKRRWKAEACETRKVQLIRRWSLPNLRGTVGDLIRDLRRKTARPPRRHQQSTGQGNRRQHQVQPGPPGPHPGPGHHGPGSGLCRTRHQAPGLRPDLPASSF